MIKDDEDYLKALNDINVYELKKTTNLIVSKESIDSFESVIKYLVKYIKNSKLSIHDDLEVVFSYKDKTQTLGIIFKDNTTIDYIYKSGETKIEGNGYIRNNPMGIQAILNFIE